MTSLSTMDTFPGRERLNDPDAFHALGAQAVRADAGGPVGTAVVDPDGRVQFFDDIYGYDDELKQALAKGYPYPG